MCHNIYHFQIQMKNSVVFLCFCLFKFKTINTTEMLFFSLNLGLLGSIYNCTITCTETLCLILCVLFTLFSIWIFRFSFALTLEIFMSYLKHFERPCVHIQIHLWLPWTSSKMKLWSYNWISILWVFILYTLCVTIDLLLWSLQCLCFRHSVTEMLIQYY